MTIQNTGIARDVENISNIKIVPRLLEVLCHSTGMGFAAVARVTEDKWVACCVKDDILFGLEPGGELKVETTICNEIRQSTKPVVINHVAKDKIYQNQPTAQMYGFQSYISMPILRGDGVFFGTLSAIDPKPRRINNSKVISLFTLCADLIAFHLNALEQIQLTEANLLEERRKAEQRDQFIAILGHDLRNPVSAIISLVKFMTEMPMDIEMARIVALIQDSSFRVNALIENILDFARGHLGEGIILNYNSPEPLKKIVEQVISELRTVWPDQIFYITINLDTYTCCDSKRIAQLFSNLLSNAITHGKKNAPIKIFIISSVYELTLSIANEGEKIPENMMKHLFEPFTRGKLPGGREGLGLGLFISSEIAHAHQGTIDVTSTIKETCFTLRIPNRSKTACLNKTQFKLKEVK